MSKVYVLFELEKGWRDGLIITRPVIIGVVSNSEAADRFRGINNKDSGSIEIELDDPELLNRLAKTNIEPINGQVIEFDYSNISKEEMDLHNK